jgi:hypothetical protein
LYRDAGQDVSNSCYIGQIFGQTSSGGVPVIINTNHKLGTATSSKRFKEDIQPMDRRSEALFSLKPVSFRYKKDIDPAGTPQLGLVAEDVEHRKVEKLEATVAQQHKDFEIAVAELKGQIQK